MLSLPFWLGFGDQGRAFTGGPPISYSIEQFNSWNTKGAANRCLKSHWTHTDHMADPEKRVIYVMRNAMDVYLECHKKARETAEW